MAKRPTSDLDEFLLALAWLVGELDLSAEEKRKVEDYAKRQAESRALYAQASMVAMIWEAVRAAQAENEPVEEFQARVVEGVERAWKGAKGWEVVLLAGLAVQGAYQRGRWAEMTSWERGKGGDRMWRYTSALEPRTCKVCRGYHGTTLPSSHPWWMTHDPPIHGACMCTVVPADDGAEATQIPPSEMPPPGFGNPAAEWVPAWNEMPAPIADTARAKGG